MIAVTGVVKRHRRGAQEFDAIGPIDLTLSPGELVAVVGPSRAGKTTLVGLLAGWEAPDEGTATWPGAATTPPGWRDVAVVPQALVLLDELTVAENVTLPHRLDPAPDWNGAGGALDAVLAALDLTHLAERGSAEISVGERQRVMVARAVCGSPRVILADDPTAHQDDRRAASVVDALTAAAHRGAACLVTTRTPGPLTDSADRVVELGWSAAGPSEHRS